MPGASRSCRSPWRHSWCEEPLGSDPWRLRSGRRTANAAASSGFQVGRFGFGCVRRRRSANRQAELLTEVVPLGPAPTREAEKAARAEAKEALTRLLNQID